MKTGFFALALCLSLLLSAFILLPSCGQRDADEESVASADIQIPNGVKPDNLEKAPEPAPEKPAVPALQTFGKMHQGLATYYRATGKGNCSFDASDDLLVVAINTTDYADAALCGGHLRVTGPKGEVTVRVVDRCPGCKEGDIDLSKQAFEKIASLSSGRVPVSWQIVAGNVQGPVTYFYMDGTTRYWTAIQIRNHRWPIASLEIMPKGASEWIPVQRRRYNYFVHPRPIAKGKVHVRLTAATGATLQDELPEPAGGVLIQGAAQFD